MRYLLIAILLFSFTAEAFANAKVQLEKVNNPTQYKFKKELRKKNTKNNKKQNRTLTNYQYDEENYHYDKYQKYLKENLEYSQSGRMKY